MTRGGWKSPQLVIIQLLFYFNSFVILLQKTIMPFILKMYTILEREYNISYIPVIL